MLYLEAFYKSAEVKYAATILLISAVQQLLGSYTASLSTDDSVSTPATSTSSTAAPSNRVPVEELFEYLTRLASTCYVNTSMCLVQHTIPSSKLVAAQPDGAASLTGRVQVLAPQSVADLVGDASLLDTPLAWCRQGLALCDTLAGRLRLLTVLEKMHRCYYYC